MNLEELLPDGPEFQVKNKNYRLRIPNLSDQARFNELMGTDPKAIAEVFNSLNWNVISKLVYRLLEDKSDFIAQEQDYIDDDGVKVKALVTGPAILMQSMNIQEALKMLGALSVAMKLSQPKTDYTAQSESKKKTTPSRLTGQRS